MTVEAIVRQVHHQHVLKTADDQQAAAQVALATARRRIEAAERKYAIRMGIAR